jgi:hypothetical protein
MVNRGTGLDISRLPYRPLQRTLALVIALHNAEEAVTAAAYLPRVREYIERVPALRDAGLPPSLPQLYLALVAVTLVPALLIGWATTGRDSALKREVVAIIAAALLWNVSSLICPLWCFSADIRRVGSQHWE